MKIELPKKSFHSFSRCKIFLHFESLSICKLLSKNYSGIVLCHSCTAIAVDTVPIILTQMKEQWVSCGPRHVSELFSAINTQVEIMFRLLVILKINYMVGLLSGIFTTPVCEQSVDVKFGTYCHCLMELQVWKSTLYWRKKLCLLLSLNCFTTNKIHKICSIFCHICVTYFSTAFVKMFIFLEIFSDLSSFYGGSGSSVDIATGCGLDGPGIESR